MHYIIVSNEYIFLLRSIRWLCRRSSHCSRAQSARLSPNVSVDVVTVSVVRTHGRRSRRSLATKSAQSCWTLPSLPLRLSSFWWAPFCICTRDGNLQDIVDRGSLHEFLVSLHREFGSVASFWFGGRPVVSLGSVHQLRQHINPNHTTLSEMESMLLSVVKERKAQKKQTAFVDALLQSSLTERQVMEDCMVFTLAGCVITANLCIWALHFLSTSEDVQDKLYKELDEVLGSDPVSLDKIPQLRYCQQVLNETVRTAKLTPVAARLQGVEGKVDQHVIPKETLVIYALGVVLQDSDTWNTPYRFDPDRFEEESVEKSFCLLGFSGNQTCPELRFAYTVATVLLSALVRQLKLHQLKGHVVEVRSQLVSTPKDETWLTVSRRR
uniref:cytochrome P450 20A1 isoform X3 n=1 Tax=Gasterosteus aculeatus aculeatus TaxID=481459 RepID=UPI001A98C391|nr:cytochrome P450 20A1 isoform X3 [Gasterosteus aculeatus aculeatus]